MSSRPTTPLAAVPDFDHEMETTRRLLERVPMDRAAWKPHPKSTSLGALAAHVAGLASFGSRIAALDEVDMTVSGQNRPPSAFATTGALLEAFDASVAAARAAIERLDADALARTWTLRAGSNVFFSLPRANVFRVFMMNHIIHHRGQLSVYLRLNDIPVPSIYGPSADEGQM